MPQLDPEKFFKKYEDEMAREKKSGSASSSDTAAAPFSPFQSKYLEEIDAQQKKNAAIDTAKERASVPNWSMWQNFLDNMLLGYALPGQALMGEKGQPHDEKRLSTRVRELQEQKEQWAKENPLPAAASELGGSMVPGLLAAGLAQNYVANPLLSAMPRVAATMPRVAAALSRWLPRFASEATSGAIQGAGVGGLEALRYGNENPLKTFEQNVELGAFGNPLMRSTMRGLRLASNISPETAKYAQSLAAAGVPVRSAQLLGASPVLRGLDKLFGRGGDEALRRAAYGRATELAGDRAAAIDEAWLARNMGYKDAAGNMVPGRIGQGMQQIIDKHGFSASPQFVNNVLTPLAQKASALGVDVEKEFAPTLLAIAKDIGNAGVGNSVEGKLYQQWIKKGGTLDSALRSSNSTVRNLAGELKGALETNWKSGLPQDVAENWDSLRKQYRVGSILEDWFKRNPEGVVSGELNPKLLYPAAKAHSYSGRVRDMGDIGNLAYGMRMLEPAAQHSGYMSPGQRLALNAAGVGLGGAGLGLMGMELSPWRDPFHEALHKMSQDPIGTGIPLWMLAAGAAGGGKLAHSIMGGPMAAQRMASAALLGVPISHSGGGNPLLPFASWLAPKFEEPRTRITVNPEEGMK